MWELQYIKVGTDEDTEWKKDTNILKNRLSMAAVLSKLMVIFTLDMISYLKKSAKRE